MSFGDVHCLSTVGHPWARHLDVPRTDSGRTDGISHRPERTLTVRPGNVKLLAGQYAVKQMRVS
jgi:hypothetical protein